MIAAITDDQGDAVLPNAASVMPTMVSKTSQGGAVPHRPLMPASGSPPLVNNQRDFASPSHGAFFAKWPRRRTRE